MRRRRGERTQVTESVIADGGNHAIMHALRGGQLDAEGSQLDQRGALVKEFAITRDKYLKSGGTSVGRILRRCNS